MFSSASLTQISAQNKPVEIIVDAGAVYSPVEGFGVNINAAWWLNGTYRDAMVTHPAIDLLIDSLGATIFRVLIEEIDWEATNDDGDPYHFNMEYYNKVFSEERFRGIWNTLHYLNGKGVDDELILSLMGAPPAAPPLAPYDASRSWMGPGYTIAPEFEDEFAETVVALLVYARNTEGIRFSKVSPMNETDIISSTKGPEHPMGIVEGPDVPDAVQYSRILRKIARRLDKEGLGDIRFVTPDAAGDKLFRACHDELVKDPYLMGKLAGWGVHQYGNDASNYAAVIRKDNLPARGFWVTETAGIRNLMGQLDDGASGYIFWDGFDCVYQHGRRNGYGSVPPNDWVFWEKEPGKPLLAFDSIRGTWTPRKQFFEFAQVFRYVKPGARRIASSVGPDSVTTTAFLNPDGMPAVVGRNQGKMPVRVSFSFTGLGEHPPLTLIVTNRTCNMCPVKESDEPGSGIYEVPGETTFTLVGQPVTGYTQMALWSGNIPDMQPVAGPETTHPSDYLVAGKPIMLVEQVSVPTLTYYPPKGRNTGAAVVVFPGGGYMRHAQF